MDRRLFLKNSGIAMAGFGMMGMAPGFLHQFANAQAISDSKAKKKILVVVFQRGAVDGLNMVVPFGEDSYYGLRPTISIPAPGKAGGAINLDGYFGLHPALKSLGPFWQSKQLAIVNSAGSPDNTRSHFDAQDYMESATPGNKGTRDGWLNRILTASRSEKDSPFRGLAMAKQAPRSMAGKYPTIAMSDIGDFGIKAGIYSGPLKGGFEGIYQENVKDSLGEAGRETFEAVNFIKQADPARYKPENGAKYPNSPFGRSLMQVGQMIKANVGLEVAFTETGGWDTHSNEVNAQNRAQGALANLLSDFGGAIGAFAVDMGKRMDDVLILTMSEFGRTAKENGSRGTDHGHGNAMFLLGNSVKGGKVYGDWKGLKPSELYEGRDLAVTTDFRDVFAEVAYRHLSNKELNTIFPGFQADRKNFRGFLA